MSVEGLEHHSKDQLVEELINRQTFVGIVIFHRGDAKAGRLDPGEILITKSPPLSREGVENLLQVGQSLVPELFGDGSATFCIHADRPPLRVDQGGAVRIGNSRISLDLVVEQYENGMTPEDLVRAYDTLVLADVHAVIAYYLRHREEVRAYLKRREVEADALRAKIESERPASRGKRSLHATPPGRRAMLRLASDADVNGEIVRGLRRRLLEIDLVRAQDALPEGTGDPHVLAWAAAENRILITNDRNTMVGFAYQRVAAGESIPGLIVTTNQQSIGSAIDDILVIAVYMPEEQIKDQVVIFLPFRG